MIRHTRSFITGLFVIALSLLWLFACKKSANLSPDNTTGPADLTTKVVSAKVSGFVTDENNIPFIGANVKVGTSTTTTTDQFGYFEVSNAEVIKNAAVVTVSQAGYYKGIKTFIAAEGKSAFFRIKLIPKTNAGTVSGTSGGEVTLTNGLKIAFPANGVMVDGSGAAYSGTVNVAAYWIKPTGADLPLEMPGDLRALNKGNELRQLTTYGMVAVELSGASGEALQVATGKKATITMPIPSSIIASAPASIALWHFDETKGLWVEEGTATKTVNTFVGEVSHFSFWGVAIPNIYVPFDCRLLFPNGSPVQYARVDITLLNAPQSAASGFSDNNGYVSGAIPVNESFRLDVFYCGSSMYSQNFTSSNTGISLGNISISATNLVTVTGTVTNCANQPVTNGYVWLFAYGYYSNYPVSSAGTFDFTLPQCGTSNLNVQFFAQDNTSGEQSPPQTVTLNSGANNIGNLQTCGVPGNQFVDITLEGQRMIYIPPTDTIHHRVTGAGVQDYIYSGGYRVINGSNVFTKRTFEYSNTGIGAGSTQPLLRIDEVADGSFSYMYGLTNPINVNITEYGPVGGFIAGNFSGQVTNLMTQNISIVSCQFRVRRNP